MKKLNFYLLLLAIPFLCQAQDIEQKTKITRDKNGAILSVEFSAEDSINRIPISSDAFLRDYLKVTAGDQFRAVQHTSKRKEFVHQHFDQYYNGVRVDGAGYNFHFKNGKMYFAQGHYVKISNLNITPSIKPEKAMEIFAYYKKIPINLIENYKAELIIKEIPKPNDKKDESIIKLV